ncbi:MAG: DUF1838 family protein [Saprospiraceae bacterium]|jgi:hypothetical protein|nr:DUF1838 family protein [Saprospiraceae bacterium]
MKNIFITSLLLILCFSLVSAQKTKSKKYGKAKHEKTEKQLDLSNPADNLDAFVKMRASLDTNEVTVYYWTGRIYSYIDGERGKPLFDLEAMNIAIIKKDGNDYKMLTREAAIYRDINTGKIIEKWYNPFISDTVDVVHVWNDPVNQTYALKGRFGDWGVPYKKMGNGRVAMYSDIFLMYPSPLPVKDFPENSRSDQYQAAELFQFFLDEKQLLNPKTKNIYSEVGWTRVSDFLPWMRMGSKPGNLVYQCRGFKTNGGFETIPEEFRSYILKHKPEFAAPPKTYATPNMTSWKYFKELKK